MRYSRKGSAGSKGEKGSAGVRISVVAHDTGCLPTVRSALPPRSTRTLSRSNRWRHSARSPEWISSSSESQSPPDAVPAAVKSCAPGAPA